MADAKLTALTAASALAGADLFYLSQGGASVKGTLTQMLTLVGTTYLPLAGGTVTGPLSLTGNISAAAWTTTGIKLKGGGSTLTDTSSSGTVAAAVTNALGGNTIAASSATTFSDYFSTYISDPIAGTNVTLTNKWSLGLEGKIKAAGGTMTGALTIASGTLTASAPALNITQTWNAVGTRFDGAVVNVTNTASAAGSFIQTWQLAGVNKMAVNKSGGLEQYGLYTDASNYDRLRIAVAGATIDFLAEGAGTGASALDIAFTTKGTGVVRFNSPCTVMRFSLANARIDVSRITSDFNVTDLTLDCAATKDVIFKTTAGTVETARIGYTGTLKLSGANAQSTGLYQLSELTTIAAAATTDTTIQMPAGAIILGVTARVTVAVTCTTNFNIGDSGSATRFGTGISKAANTTNVGSVAPYLNASALSVRITPDTTPSDNTGRVRITIYYFLMTAATS